MAYWNKLKEVLPDDKQEIIVYDEGMGKELTRVFYLDFYLKHQRVLYCSEFCKRWRTK